MAHQQEQEHRSGFFKGKKMPFPQGSAFTADLTEDSQQAFALLSSIFEGTQDLIAAQDTHFRYIAFNRAYQEESKRIFGADIEIGASMIEALAHLPEDQKIFAEIWGRALRGETFTITREFGGERRTRNFYEIRFSPIHDNQGRPIGAVQIARNVTSHRRAQETLRQSEEKYRSLAETVPLFLWTALPDGTNDFCNQRWLDYCGLSMEESIAGGWTRVLHPDEREDATKAQAQAIAQGQPFTSEERYRRTDGMYRWHYVQMTPVQDERGKIVKWIGTATDIHDLKLAEVARRESEEKYRLLVENQSDLVVKVDLEGRFLFASPSYCRTFGKTEAELLGNSFMPLVHEEDRELTGQAMEKLHRPPHSAYIEQRAKTIHGWRWFAWADTAVLDETGQVTAIIGVGRDITKRKLAEEALRASEERFRAVLETSLDVAYRRNLWTDCYDYMSPVVEQTIGFTADEMKAMSIGEILERIHPDDLEDVASALTRLEETGTEALQYRFKNKDGEYRWLADHLSLLKDQEGKPLYRCGIFRDIHDQKRTEEALLEADRRKDEFLAMLAHELRNPLAPIRNAVQLLRQAGTDDALLQRQRDIIDRQVTHMARLLDDLLDVSRIVHGKIELDRQPLRLADVISHAIEIAMPLIESRGHGFFLVPPADDLYVEADPHRLAQVMGNLLANAAKYTNEQGRIWLEVARDGDEAVVSVRDSGIGIAPEMLPRIFDLFSQADQSLARSQGGLGIGLTMVRNLVKMHGGRVVARSDGAGQGSEFTVYLPALPQDTPTSVRPEEPEVSESTIQSRRILVVDDIVDTSESFAELLDLWGHQVRTAHSGPTALALARLFCPEVVILDIGMPGMDGFEVARRLRRQHQGQSLLVVALTGYGQESDRQKSQAAGFDHHLVKPVDLNALRELLDLPVV